MKLNKRHPAVIPWIKNYLNTAHARSIEDLIQCSPFSRQEMQTALKQLIEHSEIEVLEPVGASHDRRSQRLFHPYTHFRLIRETDTHHRWQILITEKMMRGGDWSRGCRMPMFA